MYMAAVAALKSEAGRLGGFGGRFPIGMRVTGFVGAPLLIENPRLPRIYYNLGRFLLIRSLLASRRLC